MNELASLLLVVVALAIGWGLGRRERRQSKSYELGLRHLLNEQQDEAVETLVEALRLIKTTLTLIWRWAGCCVVEVSSRRQYLCMRTF